MATTKTTKQPDAEAATKPARDWEKEENALVSRIESHGLKAADARKLAKKKIAARKAKAAKKGE